MGRSVFEHADFLDAALALVAERGPSTVTVGAITGRLQAPTGSFYHRFASRDALLGELWLNTVLAFQAGFGAALAAGDGLGAALHTPAWVREHPDGGRLLLLHHRDDFVQGDWPPALRDRVAEHTRQASAALEKFAADTFGHAGPEELRRVQFVLANVPVAAVRQHLQRREPPPPIVDELIRATYHAIIGSHGGGRQSPVATKRSRPPRQRRI
jgi:AcrR family transcriptional regulator